MAHRHILGFPARDVVGNGAADALAGSACKKAEPPRSDVQDPVSYPCIVQKIQRRLVVLVAELWEGISATEPPAPPKESTLLAATVVSAHLPIFSISAVHCADCLHGAFPPLVYSPPVGFALRWSCGCYA